MLALNWEAIGSDGINIQDLFSADDIAKFTKQKSAARYDADQIKLWDSTNQKYIELFCRLDKDGNYFGWAPLGTPGTLADNILHSGDAMWFLLNGSEDVDVTLKGEVLTSAQKVYSFAGDGFNMFGNGYPTVFTVNDPKIDWIAAGAVAQKSANRYDADQIKIWDAENQKYIELFCRLDKDGNYFGWAPLGTPGTKSDATISIGHGAWYIRNSSVDMDWSFLRPFETND